MFPLNDINKSWTLFLDRDGVINQEKHNDYIHEWSEFVFYEGVPEAMKTFNSIFGRIIVVTNQRGIGKGLTLSENVDVIHRNMTASLTAAGGRVDKVYYCPDMDENSPNRKPNPGMGLQAKADFPEIDFSRSVMVGNTLSDMEFGRNLGSHNVFIASTRPEISKEDNRIDLYLESLHEFAQLLANRP